MKKAVCLLLSVFMLLACAGCGAEKNIVGSWYNEGSNQATVTFFSDGRYMTYSSSGIENEEGTWEIHDNTLLMTSSSRGRTFVSDIIELKNDHLTFLSEGQVVTLYKYPASTENNTNSPDIENQGFSDTNSQSDAQEHFQNAVTLESNGMYLDAMLEYSLVAPDDQDYDAAQEAIYNFFRDTDSVKSILFYSINEMKAYIEDHPNGTGIEATSSARDATLVLITGEMRFQPVCSSIAKKYEDGQQITHEDIEEVSSIISEIEDKLTLLN